MKYRRDFVTNSSSSSYVCEICGREESGWDISLPEAEMMECENGHVFCCDEALEIPNKKELVKKILENKWNEKNTYDHDKKKWVTKIHTEEELIDLEDEDLFNNFCSEDGYYDVPEFVCPICQFIEYSEEDMSAFLFKEYKVSRDEVFELVKATNKRRRKLYESEYISEVCRRFNLNPIEIAASWKERFSTYKNFWNYIK